MDISKIVAAIKIIRDVEAPKPESKGEWGWLVKICEDMQVGNWFTIPEMIYENKQYQAMRQRLAKHWTDRKYSIRNYEGRYLIERKA